MSVQEYAASEMKYLCDAEDPGVGYSQPARWSWYERCDNAGWLTSDADGDCSSMVAGCYNIAFHNELGSPYTRDGTGGMFPVSNQTWTGAIPALAAGRGFVDRGDSWVGSTPAGGFRVGDLLMADGHVAMAVRDADGSFDGRDPLLAEAWIDSHGSDGWDDPDEPVGDQDGGETRLIRYADHPFTQRASWTTVLSYEGAPVPTIITDRISLLEGADDMRVTHVLFAHEGTMYLYCVLSHTYTPIPDPGTLEDVKFILARAGARVEDWLEFNRGSSLEVGNLKAFGRFVPLDG